MSDQIYLFLDNVAGSCKEANHEGWIPIHSIDFEASRDIEFKLFTEKLAPESSSPTISKIIITKSNCTASPKLFANYYSLLKSKMIVDIVHNSSGSGSLASKISNAGSTRYESEVCYISKYKLGGSTGERTSEIIEIAVSSLSINYNPPIDAHDLDKKSSAGYDFQALKPL